jgi:hypothetical protein
MDIVDPGLGQAIRKDRLGKAGLARQGNRTDVDQPLDPGRLQRGD